MTLRMVRYPDTDIFAFPLTVSLKTPRIYTPEPSTAFLAPNGKPLRVIAVDVGMVR